MSKKNLKKRFFLSLSATILAPITLVSCEQVIEKIEKVNNKTTENTADNTKSTEESKTENNNSNTVEPNNSSAKDSETVSDTTNSTNTNENNSTQEKINISAEGNNSGNTNTDSHGNTESTSNSNENANAETSTSNNTNTSLNTETIDESETDDNATSYKNVRLQTDLNNQLTNKVDSVAYSSKIIEYTPRKGINKQYYVSPVQTKYKAHGFKFPGYAFNYEDNWDGVANEYRNSFLTVNGTKTNISDILLAEKNDEGKDFSDPEWIKKEISKNTLKKHPAADEIYERKISNETKAIVKKINIDTQFPGYSSLGVYGVAGEVVEIQFDEDTYNTLKHNYANNTQNLPFEFTYNRNFWNNYGYNNTGRISNRYPKIQSKFVYKFSEIDPETRTIKLASPFGGGISLNVLNTVRDASGEPMILGMTFKNAIETLHFEYGRTTIEQWNDQVRRVKSGEIAAPAASIQTKFTSILMPFTGLNEVSRVNIDNVKYPGEVLRKWDNFFRISYKWKNYNGRRMAMDYCDDIWSGAAAWNGGNILWAGTWAAAGYFTGDLDFGFDNWVNYHEINHYFEDHGWTNIPSIINLSFINDKSRQRNTLTSSGEYGAGWSWLGDAWSVADKNTNWYGMYANMVYNLGPINFMEATKYVSSIGWRRSLQKAAVGYSDFFKLDVRYALEAFAGLRKKAWEFNQVVTSVSEADKTKLSKYPSFDFVGNLYAAGQYLNTSGKTQKDTYEYIGDVMPAFEIAAGQPFVFEFDKYIRSVNDKFVWDSLRVEKTSKLGGKLEVLVNGKQVKYTASNNNLNENDEFDLTIIPGTWEGKPENYVKSYKFKIKIRNVVNRPHVRIIKANELEKQGIPLTNIETISSKVLEKLNSNSIEAHDMVKDYDGPHYFNRSRGDLMISEFIMKTKELGQYAFNWPENTQWFKIEIQRDGTGNWEEVFKVNDTHGGNSTRRIAFLNSLVTQNDFVKVRIWYYNKHGQNSFNVWLSYKKDSRSDWSDGYDINKVAYSPFIKSLEEDFTVWDKFRNDEIYGYKRRFLPEDNRDNLELKRYVKKVVPTIASYTLEGAPKDGSAGFDKVFDGKENTRFELWANATVVANISYSKKETLNYIQFKRWNTHKSWFVGSVKVEAKMSNGTYKTVASWSGRGKTQPDWWTLYFNEIVTTDEVKVTLTSSNEDNNNAIIFSLMELGADLRKPNAIVPINNINNKFRGKWELKTNDAQTLNSYINGISAYTTKINSSISFEVTGTQLGIIGKSAENLGTFDVYVDDVLVGENISAASENTNYNKMLFFAPLGQKTNHKVTIVAKENKPLYINYLATSNK
ncbi:hypothetical protein ACJA23_03220 [Mycoplasma corogypsi]|uniref:hypothetical protein n=1 Tax=Mycoplasma corogypsi TaxID=2106 RepID=UPI003872CDBC